MKKAKKTRKEEWGERFLKKIIKDETAKATTKEINSRAELNIHV
jgi:hypothetical protein